MSGSRAIRGHGNMVIRAPLTLVKLLLIKLMEQDGAGTNIHFLTVSTHTYKIAPGTESNMASFRHQWNFHWMTSGRSQAFSRQLQRLPPSDILVIKSACLILSILSLIKILDLTLIFMTNYWFVPVIETANWIQSEVWLIPSNHLAQY